MSVYEKEKFSAPMPWIGLYVAVASLICSIAMAADAFIGFHNKKLWFPCRFFTLNAATLTLLAVAMKIPADLNTPMPTITDQLSKLSSIIFMCTVMGNFMPCLGQMSNKDIIMNLTALAILVITIFGNLCIQLGTGVLYTDQFPTAHIFGLRVELIMVIFLMPVLLVIVCFSALSIPSTRKYIDLKYSEINKKDSSEELDETKRLEFDKLKEYVRNYWIMAVTGYPQFVIGRSVTCCVSGAICILNALILVEAELRLYFFFRMYIYDPSMVTAAIVSQISDYKWSTSVILLIQTIGVVIGTIAPAMRWFSDIKMKCLGKREKSYTSELKTEKYWTEKLVEWRESPLPFEIQSKKFQKLVHVTRNLFLSFCIRVQIVIVVASKSIQLLFVPFMTLILLCYHFSKWVLRKLIPICTISSNHTTSTNSEHVRNVDLSYVLLLEGEKKLPERMLRNIHDVADRLIQMGRKKQPKLLMELLQKSAGFNGLVEFDSEKVPSLSSCEPPNCWMLPLVTLTSIAISLPNIESHMVKGLRNSVREGLEYVRLVEKDLDVKMDLIYIRKAAELTWFGIKLYDKWSDTDLRKMAPKWKDVKTTLQSLSEIAKDSVTEFKGNTNESVKENPLKWPAKVIAANSMYRISQTLLLNIENTEKSLFEKISVMISEIMSACLTNLPHVITTKCFSSAIEKREESVQHAARVLGETEEILNFLQRCKLPSLDPNQAAYIDHWRAIIKNPSSASSSSYNDTISSGSGDKVNRVGVLLRKSHTFNVV